MIRVPFSRDNSDFHTIVSKHFFSQLPFEPTHLLYQRHQTSGNMSIEAPSNLLCGSKHSMQQRYEGISRNSHGVSPRIKNVSYSEELYIRVAPRFIRRLWFWRWNCLARVHTPSRRHSGTLLLIHSWNKGTRVCRNVFRNTVSTSLMVSSKSYKTFSILLQQIPLNLSLG